MAEQTTGAAGAQGGASTAAGAGTAAPAAGAAAPAAAATNTTPPAQPAGTQEAAPGTQAAAATESGKTTTDGKPADAKPAAPAPIEVTMPEGFKADEATLKEFTALVADEKLSRKDLAQKLVDLQVKQAQAQERAFRDQLAAQPAKDLEALKSDPVFGGPNHQKTITDATRAAQQFFGEDLKALLEPLGIQNDPRVVKGLARIAQAVAEDSVGNKIRPAPDMSDPMRTMFPKSYDQMTASRRR